MFGVVKKLQPNQSLKSFPGHLVPFQFPLEFFRQAGNWPVEKNWDRDILMGIEINKRKKEI